MRVFLITMIASIPLLFLSACDGGSGSGGNDNVNVPPPEPPLETFCEGVVLEAEDPGRDSNPDSGVVGFLVDSNVSGVAYETPTHEGVTALDGSFRYEEGETVRFLLGDTLLGEVIGQPQVTVFDLAGSEVITGTPNIKHALATENGQFYSVINISVLLQSFDRDADPENGIRISTDVAALFEGVSLDVSQNWETFSDEFELRHALSQANAKCLVSDKPHSVVKPPPALRHVYETLKIDARTHAENYRIAAEEDITFYEQTTQYDADGYITRQTFDGEPHLRELIWQYSSTGQLTRAEIDDPFDEIPNSIWSWEYDEFDYLTAETYGDQHTLYSRMHGYDSDGNRVRSEHRNPEGKIVATSTYEFDASGNRIRAEERDADGAIHEVTTYEYNADGNLIHVHWEEGQPDGRPAELWDDYYDAFGNKVRETVDRDANGVLDEVRTKQYSEDGILTHSREELFRLEDGIVYSVQMSEYDSHGNEVLYTGDADNDGIPDEITRHLYEYDVHGNIVLVTRDEDDDGTLEHLERHAYDYDAAGNLTRVTNDFDGDGLPEWITSYQYDEHGNLTQEAIDNDADGNPDQIENISYIQTGWGFIFDPSAELRADIIAGWNDGGSF